MRTFATDRATLRFASSSDAATARADGTDRTASKAHHCGVRCVSEQPVNGRGLVTCAFDAARLVPLPCCVGCVRTLKQSIKYFGLKFLDDIYNNQLTINRDLFLRKPFYISGRADYPNKI